MSNNTKEKKVTFLKNLFFWYYKNQRDLPWRNTGNPYDVWLSEVMLQQIQVDAVIPYYNSFLERFPDLTSLAHAHLVDFLKYGKDLVIMPGLEIYIKPPFKF